MCVCEELIEVCPICEGEGKLVNITCPKCDGSGRYDWIDNILNNKPIQLKRKKDIGEINYALSRIHETQLICASNQLRYCNQMKDKIKCYLENIEGISHIDIYTNENWTTRFMEMKIEFDFFYKRYGLHLCLHPKI